MTSSSNSGGERSQSSQSGVAVTSARDSAQTQKLQQQFLPAALEVQDAPPSPTGRGILWLILGLFAIGIAWSAIGEVNIVVSASGRLIPAGHVKTVQAPEAAKVTHIHITEGDQVAQGQALISLDTTAANADDTRIAKQLTHNRVQQHWRQGLEGWFATKIEQGLATIPGVSGQNLQHAQWMLEQQRQQFVSTTLAYSRDLAATAAQESARKKEEERASATLAVLLERVAAYRTLVDSQHGARVQYLELLQQQKELEATIPVLKSQQRQLAETAAAIAARRDAAEATSRNNNLIALEQLRAERSALMQDARRAQLREQQLLITSPIAGHVQELSIHTIGAMVTVAQPLLKVVPNDATIEVEALLLNKDIGFVEKGQRADIKIEAFNFTRYGLIESQVIDISDDAIMDENLGWVFKMRLALKQDTLTAKGKEVRLSPGMAVTAEMKTGKRRLIEFFLSPLLRYRQESLRER